jgi:hypothetical protein
MRSTVALMLVLVVLLQYTSAYNHSFYPSGIICFNDDDDDDDDDFDDDDDNHNERSSASGTSALVIGFVVLN